MSGKDNKMIPALYVLVNNQYSSTSTQTGEVGQDLNQMFDNYFSTRILLTSSLERSTCRGRLELELFSDNGPFNFWLNSCMIWLLLSPQIQIYADNLLIIWMYSFWKRKSGLLSTCSSRHVNISLVIKFNWLLLSRRMTEPFFLPEFLHILVCHKSARVLRPQLFKV